MAEHNDHSDVAFKLNETQHEAMHQMDQALQDSYNGMYGYVNSAFKRGTKEVTVELLPGVRLAGVEPDGSVWCCPRCLFRAIQTLRDHADLLEDVARKLEVKEPVLDEWQRPDRK